MEKVWIDNTDSQFRQALTKQLYSGQTVTVRTRDGRDQRITFDAADEKGIRGHVDGSVDFAVSSTGGVSTSNASPYHNYEFAYDTVTGVKYMIPGSTRAPADDAVDFVFQLLILPAVVLCIPLRCDWR